jgi:uncharacterized protein (TIGR03067 family)
VGLCYTQRGICRALGQDISVLADAPEEAGCTNTDILAFPFHFQEVAMRTHALWGLAAGVLIAADAPRDASPKKELKKLQGTWILVSAERDGKKLAEDVVKKTKITFKSDTFVFPDASGIGTSQKGIIKVDPSKTPKWMDTKATNDAAKGELSLCIYEIAGDDYKVCFAPPGKDRPKEFSSKPASGHILQVWKREKK